MPLSGAYCSEVIAFMLKNRFLKIVLLLTAGVAAMLFFCSCGEKAPENVEYSTFLNVSSSFSGSRTVKISYPASVIEPGSQTADDLDSVITKNCPSSMTFTKDRSDDRIAYVFTLAFSSYSDYTSKLSDILGNPPVVTFSNPNTPLTKGWRISEDFQSCQLFGWIDKRAAAEGITLPDAKSAETETKVTFGNTTVDTEPAITVNKLNGQPIEKITVVTVNKTNQNESKYDRTITFTVTQNTFDSLGDKLTEYFSSVTDTSASSEWLLENDKYIYTVNFADISMKQLEGYTNRLLSSVYGDVSYVDKTVGNTALAYQNSFTETLDFSNYVGPGNSDVPVEYSYSLLNDSTLDECRIYSDLRWITAEDVLKENNPGKIAAVRNRAPSLTVRINDGKQYVPKSIDINVTPVGTDNIKKSISFVYDIAQDGYEASDYTASYFTPLGMIPSQTVDQGNAVCTITLSGTAAELNSKLTDIFGDNNLITMSTSVPFMTLRTKKHIDDNVDLSALLVGKNSDTPVNYTIVPADNELAEEMTIRHETDEADTSIEPDEEGKYTIGLGDSKGHIRFTVSAPNITDIIIFCAIGFIMILVTAGFIFVLRRQKPMKPALEDSGEPSPEGLPEGESPAQSAKFAKVKRTRKLPPKRNSKNNSKADTNPDPAERHSSSGSSGNSNNSGSTRQGESRKPSSERSPKTAAVRKTGPTGSTGDSRRKMPENDKDRHEGADKK